MSLKLKNIGVTKDQRYTQNTGEAILFVEFDNRSYVKTTFNKGMDINRVIDGLLLVLNGVEELAMIKQKDE